MASSFLGAIQERGFRGDEELADLLRATTGHAAIPLLRPLAVDLEMLAVLLAGVHRRTGPDGDPAPGKLREAHFPVA